MTKDIHLGFELYSGRAVAIPLKHLAITGQTQEAGKTTALEALITRSGLRAVTFITKRGEGSFTGARRIDPYFREQADWQFVASILETSRGEKLKFERAWIIRASKGARTLADVHRNVRKAMETAKGMSADVYLTLDAYLEVVVPQIGEVRWAPRVELQPGVNAMDLIGLAEEMQHLVIKSTLDWVLQHEHDTAVVVPEAWKFIPQGRGTPVKLAAERFIRQAAALRNFLWLDSQDIAGIEKIILKSVPLWILGVQREANEIKRTLDNIPAGVAKPSRADIATLEIGQFFVCWGRHCLKTYVQPVWLDADQAREVATGKHVAPPRSTTPDVGDVIDLPRGGKGTITGSVSLMPLITPPTKEPEVTKEEADALRRENDRLTKELATLRERLGFAGEPVSPSKPAAPAPVSLADTMVNERLYQAIKDRLVKEAPGILKVLAIKPELEVRVERRVIQMDDTNFRGRIARMLAAGFYDQGATNSATRKELARTGKDMDNKSIWTFLEQLKGMGFLTKDGDRYVAVPGMKVNIVEG